jgi:small conductance mechanosensitive channel
LLHSCLRGLAALILLGCTSVASAQQASPPDAPAPEVAPEDIERVIATLEDPTARAELLGELRALLAAEQAAEPEDELLITGDDLVETLRSAVANAWEALLNIDPLRVLSSTVISLGIVVAALILRWLVLRLLKRLYRRLSTPASASAEDLLEVAEIGAQTPEARVPDDQGETLAVRPELPSTVTRLINLIIGVVAVLLIADAWGAGFGELLQTDLGARIAESAMAIGLILVLTTLAWHVAGLVVARLLILANGRANRERRARRLDTLVPLLRSTLQVVIVVLAALLVLGELGVNIAPLLAGAGILGLAIGFGAQTLVKDIITGVTMLLEDSASVGDVVEVSGHAGVVENMRIRVMQLRDLAGVVHVVPYGEITTIMNYTKDFAYYLMEVGVAYREDTDEVCGVLTALAEAMRHEPEYRRVILEPLEILGVDKFADSAVIIKARLKTTAGDQWRTGREFNRRLKKRFDELGIEIPFPHTTVYFGEPKEGKAPPARLAIAAENGAGRMPGGPDAPAEAG